MNDQNDILEELIPEQYYSTKTIIVSSFFGGLPGSGYMIYKNFKKAGEHTKANISISLSCVLLLLLFLSAFSYTLERIPDIVFSIFFSLLTAVLVNRYQKKMIDDRIINGADYFPVSKAVIICIIAIIITFGIFFALYLLQDLVVNEEMTL